jgi:hypothetical protein
MESKLAASEKLTQLQELVAANAELLARFAEAFNSFKTEDPRLALVSPEEAGFLFPDILPIINTIMTLTPEDLGIKRLETRDGNQIPHYTAIEQHYVGPDGKQRSPNIKYLPEHVHAAWQQMNQAYQASLSEDGTTNRGLHIASGYRSPGYQALALTEAINDRGLEVLIFTGGIGEKAYFLRRRICEKFGYLGLKLDMQKNRGNKEIISAADSQVTAMVIPANEELQIARECAALLKLKPAAAKA